jgi:hypothetical protein
VTRLSRLTKIGLLLLPWLPAAFLFGSIRYRQPDTEWVLAGKMSMDRMIVYSDWEQREQAYPHIHLFAVIFLLAAAVFVAGLTLLVISYFRQRRARTDVPATI